MSREDLIKGLGFISTVVIPVLTLAVTASLTYLKNTTDNNIIINPEKEIDSSKS